MQSMHNDGDASSHNYSAREKQVRKVTWIGLLLNLFLSALKFLAGFFGKSQALIADAVHSISDFFTDAVVLIGLKMGRKAPDDEHHFGHARIETLASAIVGLALIATAFYLGIDAVKNITSNVEYHPTWLVIFLTASIPR